MGATAHADLDAATLAAGFEQTRRCLGYRPFVAHWSADGGALWYAVDGRAAGIDLDSPGRPVMSAFGIDELTGVDGCGALARSGDRWYRLTAPGRPPRALSDVEAAAALRGQARVIRSQFPTTFSPLIERLSPDGRWALTLDGDQLALRSVADDGIERLTEDGVPGWSFDASSESFDTLHACWSPDGRFIAAARLDTRHVYKIPLLSFAPPGEQLSYQPYPRAGEAMERFELYVFDLADRSRRLLDIGPSDDRYVNLLGWCGEEVYFAVIRRDHKHLEIRAADPRSGTSRRVIDEHSQTYINTPMTVGPPYFFPIDGGFLLLSERSGWRQIYRYRADGELVRQLTDGRHPVHDIVGLDGKRGWIYFRAHPDEARPYDRHLFRVRLDGGDPRRLTHDAGDHDVRLAPDARHFIDTRAAADAPPVTTLRDADGRPVAELARTDTAALSADGWQPPEAFAVRSSDGASDIHGVLWRPWNFDPGGRYPLVEVIYGGMQSCVVPTGFDLTLGREDFTTRIAQALCRHGFAVVLMDGPGTPNRGKAYQDATYGTWPQGVIAEHAHVLRSLCDRYGFLDRERIGVTGLSWGGYMTQRALLDAPDLYKVGVAVAPVSDFEDHPTYIEPFMGLPRDNPEGYAAGSNLSRVAELRGRLLLAPMPLDVNAPFSASMKFVEAAIQADRAVDLMTIPEANHHPYAAPPRKAAWFFAYIVRYFSAALGNERCASAIAT